MLRVLSGDSMEGAMNPDSRNHFDWWMGKFPLVAGTTALVAGTIVLIGWLFDIPVLKSLHPDLVSMKANTALAFLLAGMSLLLHSSRGTGGQRMTARFLASVVGLIGLLTVAEYAFAWDAGIAQLLFDEPQGTFGTFSPGRMALNTAISFCLLGSALVMLKRKTKWGDGLAHLLVLVVGFWGFSSSLPTHTVYQDSSALPFTHEWHFTRRPHLWS